MAMKEIALYYKQHVLPDLRRVKVKSNGQRSQYKGHKNLGEMAEWPHAKLPLDICKSINCLCLPGGKACKGEHMKPGQGLEMFHDFAASHRGSGPVDSYSKDAREGMDLDVATGRLVRYNYVHCFDWAMEKMAKPSLQKKRRGIYGANGKYFWRAYSDGTDDNSRGFPVIPDDRSFQQLPGSNEIYGWRAKHAFLPRLEALFIPCYCKNCRVGKSSDCKYRHITHSLVAGGASEFFTTHEKKTPNRTEDSDSDF